MDRRLLLRQQLEDAWRLAIEDDYQRQRINSERSLQASLWSKLNAILPTNSRRLFIEPTLKAAVKDLDGSVKQEFKYPDVVVCNTREVIGIVEIKYLPRARPNWKKDLQTFSWIHNHRDQIIIQNVRYRGLLADDRAYPLAKDVLFVWAGVHVASTTPLSQHIDQRLTHHFLELHAHTKHDGHPELK